MPSNSRLFVELSWYPAPILRAVIGWAFTPGFLLNVTLLPAVIPARVSAPVAVPTYHAYATAPGTAVTDAVTTCAVVTPDNDASADGWDDPPPNVSVDPPTFTLLTWPSTPPAPVAGLYGV